MTTENENEQGQPLDDSTTESKKAPSKKAAAEADPNVFPEDHFLTEQLIDSASSLFDDEFPPFLVSSALHADGERSYTVEDAAKIVRAFANQKVEG